MTPLRRWLLWIVGVGLVGTASELLLLGHYEEPAQWIPLGLLASGLPVVVWALARPTAAASIVALSLGVVYLLSGALGVLLHFKGNVEFEREMYPDMAGAELVWESLTGATPALAPGTMGLLGLLLVAWAMAGRPYPAPRHTESENAS